MAKAEPAQAVQRAAHLHRQGQLDRAETIYTEVLAADRDHFDALHLLGVLRLQQGRTVEALHLIGGALRVDPRSAAAWCHLGQVQAQMNRLADALESFDQALAIAPGHADALYQRGNALVGLRRPQEAVSSYDGVIAIAPAHAEALNNRGIALIELGRTDAGLASFEAALAVKPDYVDALLNRGHALIDLGRVQDAVASFDAVLAVAPDHAGALHHRGAALTNLRRLDEALASYDRALAIRPDDVDALRSRGVVLRELGRAGDAVASFDRALALAPDRAEAWAGRGTARLDLDRPDEALADFEEALALKPGDADAIYNRGIALYNLDRAEEALASFETALALRPEFAAALHNRGVALSDLRRPAEAISSFEQALRLAPDFAEARKARSHCLLWQGDFARGWPAFESRWDGAALRDARRDFRAPLWRGEDDIAGRTILLHAEQGLGDTIQFCRFATTVLRQGARVVLEVQPELRTLMASLDGAIQVISRGDALPDFDRHCPLMSLPLACGITVASIPADIPYLRAPEDKMKLWRDRLGSTTRRRVGLVWAGSPRRGMRLTQIDRQRSVAFAQLAPLFAHTAIAFHSLQKGDQAVAQWRRSADRARVVDWSDQLVDFADTAALIANLDLVIAVDTSVAHLAGALGKPFWLLNRFNSCWRWLLHRDDSPWYPGARIFHQTVRGDWAAVIDRMASELARWGGPEGIDRPAGPVGRGSAQGS